MHCGVCVQLRKYLGTWEEPEVCRTYSCFWGETRTSERRRSEKAHSKEEQWWWKFKFRKEESSWGLMFLACYDSVVKVQNYRWGNGTFRFGPPVYGCVLFITALHGMQTWSSDENSACPSVCHTRGLWQNGRKIYIPYERSFSLVFWEKEWLLGCDPLYLGQPASVGSKSPILNW